MKTFILNLPHRIERLQRSMQELSAFNPEAWSASTGTTGAYGLAMSMKELYRRCIAAEWHPVLICEDDVRLCYNSKLVRDMVYDVMNRLPTGWHQLYLGANIERERSLIPVNDYLYQVTYAKALHACIYSREGLIECLKVSRVPLDEGIADLHRNGRAYITNPMLADQYPGYSDIREKQVNYNFLMERYERGKRV